MSSDAETLAVYETLAESYAARFAADRPEPSLTRFMARLPAGGAVLDLGCGPGRASAFLRAAGFRCDPVDATPAMVALANRLHGIGARLGSFDDIAGVGVYDGVWANFSLLHAARADLPRHLAALVRALRPHGVLHLGMKTGSGAARDSLGRLYTYVAVDELRALVTDAGCDVLTVNEGVETGLAGTADPFVVMVARRGLALSE